MIEGKLADGKISNILPFDLIYRFVRRMKFLDYLENADPVKAAEGEKILKVRSGWKEINI
jgi:hypothetical protein